MAVLNTNGIELFYERRGEGPPLMLIAGIASDSQSWMPVVERLSNKFSLIMPDNRGAGRTRPLDSPISIGKMAQDCAALIEYLGFEKVHVAGHSMGGAIALELTLQSAHLVDHLVLAATRAKLSMRNRVLFDDMAALRLGGVDKVLWYKMLFQWLFGVPFFANDRRVTEAAKLAIAYPHAQTAENFVRQLEAVKQADFRDDLGKIDVPTLLVLARNDLLFPLDEAKKSLKDIANAQIRIIENAAHSVHWDNPAAFCAAVENFVLTPKMPHQT